MASPQQLAEAEAWLTQYEASVARADAGTVAAVWAAYEVIDDWENPTQTLAAAAAAAAAMQAARATQSGLMGEFLGFVTDALGGTRVRPLRSVPDYPRAAEPFDVYSRPVFAFRDAIARDLAEEQARLEAQVRAEVISLTDTLLARRDAALAVLDADDEVTHYRRVIRPELSKSGSCGLCIAASTRVYKVSDLMPIHSRCKCVVMPIINGADPERFNQADLERLYAEIPGTRREELSRFRYRVDDDTELGPVLTPAA